MTTAAHRLAQSIGIQARIIELRRLVATTSEAYHLATIARSLPAMPVQMCMLLRLLAPPRKGA
jgi:hypothetical protein